MTKAATAPKAPAPKPVIPASVLAQNPLNEALPTGLHADPVYLAFARGAGYSFTNAAEQNLAAIAAARAAYNTAASRLPDELKQAQIGTDLDAGERGVFSSGARLVDENHNRVINQQHGQDLVSARSGAIAQANSTLAQAIAQIARERADAVGSLQDRITQHANQDRYIAAIRGANSGGGGGGGGVSFSLPNPGAGLPGPPAPANPAAAAGGGNALIPRTATYAQPGQTVNAYLASDPVAHYVYGLAGPQQQNWLTFMQKAYPNADFAPLLHNLASVNSNYSTGVGNGAQVR